MTPRQLYCDTQLEIRVPHQHEAILLQQAILRSKNEIAQWESWCQNSFSLLDSERFLRSTESKRQKGSEFNFNLFDLNSQQLIGAISINRINHECRLANVGYWIHSDFTGRGLAPFAVNIISQFAFEWLGLTRLEIVVMHENIRSCRVAEKVGATPEGLHRNRLYFHGKPCHAWVYSLIPTDIYSDPISTSYLSRRTGK